jgi:hypothetical protein
MREEAPELAKRAENGELPRLGWKGGVDTKIKAKKYGSMYYLAQWQGLRGSDLDIDLSAEYTLTCSKTDSKVTFTTDANNVKGLFP